MIQIPTLEEDESMISCEDAIDQYEDFIQSNVDHSSNTVNPITCDPQAYDLKIDDTNQSDASKQNDNATQSGTTKQSGTSKQSIRRNTNNPTTAKKKQTQLTTKRKTTQTKSSLSSNNTKKKKTPPVNGGRLFEEDEVMKLMKQKFNQLDLPYKSVTIDKVQDRVIHCRRFLSLIGVKTEELYQELCGVVNYSRPKMYGKPIPRSMAWTYLTGVNVEPEVWAQKEFILQPQLIDREQTLFGKMVEKLNEFTGINWNRCLIARLEHGRGEPGKEKLGDKFHTGFNIGEESLKSLILQIGQQRKFILRPKHCRKIPEFDMESGDLLYTNNNVNKNCKHGVPVEQLLTQCNHDSFFLIFYQ